MEETAHRVFCIFNVCEGLLWISISVGFAVACGRKRQHHDLTLATAVLFLAFGLSDFVEIRTGGWYKPWWLLSWKAANVTGLLAVYLIFRKRRLGGTP